MDHVANRGRAADRPRRSVEGREESVAGRMDVRPPVACDLGPCELVVSGEEFLPALVDAAEEDVGTGGPDFTYGIFPTVKVITRAGQACWQAVICRAAPRLTVCCSTRRRPRPDRRRKRAILKRPMLPRWS